MKNIYALIILTFLSLSFIAQGNGLPDFLKIDNNFQGETKDYGFREQIKLKNKYDKMQAPVVQRPYDVLSYKIFLDWDQVLRESSVVGESRQWTGEVEMKILIEEDGFEMLDLDAGHFEILQIVIDEENIDAVQPESELLSIPLPKSKNKGDTIDLFIQYKYIGTNNIGFHLYEKGLYVGQGLAGDSVFVEERVAYLMNEPTDARFWMPCNDWPHDKATPSIRVKVPSEYTVAANGLLTQIEEVEDSKFYYWEDPAPMATYLISVAASIFKEYSEWYVPENSPEDSIEIKYYVWQQDYENTATDGTEYNAKHSLRNTRDMLKCFSNHFIPYPFVKYGIVAVQPFNFGGMEHQSLTMVNRSWLRGRDDVNLAHELAHQWLGDLITCATWNDIWINEGGASWSEALWFDELYEDFGYYYSLEYARAVYLWYGGMGLPAIYGLDFSNLFNTALTYKKSAYVYHLLKEMLGEEAFYSSLRGLLNKYKFQSINTEQFKEYFSEQNPDPIMSFDTFFQQWIYSPGHPVYRITPLVTELENQSYKLQITLNQIQEMENVPEVFVAPLRFNVFGPDTGVQIQVFNDERTQDFEFDLDFAPDSIYIDIFSVLCEFEPAIVSSVEDNLSKANSADFQVFPNALSAGQTINIEFSTSKDNSIVTMDLYDYLGNKIDNILNSNLLSGKHKVSYNLGSLPLGMYFVRLSSENTVLTQKVYVKE